MRRIYIWWASLCLLWLLPLSLQSQCAVTNTAFRAGERIEYTLYFNWKFVWAKAGKAELTTTSTQYAGQPAYRIDLLAVGSKRADMFFKMRDTLTAIVSHRLEPLSFRKAAEEGKRFTVENVQFSYANGQTHVTQRRTYRDGEIKDSRHTDSRCVYDMLSILARARSFRAEDYAVGQKIVFPMTTGTAVEDQTLIYRGKDVVKAEDGLKYRCVVFSLVEYTSRGKEREVITFFVSDDDNHLPIRLDLFLNFGSAKAFLNRVSGHRHPLHSQQK